MRTSKVLQVLGAVSLVVSSAAIAGTTIPNNLEFSLKNGKTETDVYKMVDHPNSVFVFEAFSISCGYCNMNANLVNNLAAEYAANPRVQVIDLGLDRQPSAYVQWNERHAPNHPVVQDPNRIVYNSLHTQNGIPQVFVVNCKGEMVGNHVGTWDGEVDQIKALIAKGMETTCN